MSSLLNYYEEQGKTVSSNDLGASKPLTKDRCKNFYTTNNPTGWYLDLGHQTIGKRPVIKPYHVGSTTKVTPTNYVQRGKFDCKQPCWDRNCK